MKFQARTFAGMRPSRSSDLLVPGEAQNAVNARLTGGDLRPFNGTTSVAAITAGTIGTIYRYGQTLVSDSLYWFQFAGDVDICKGPVDGDTEERTYWTDGTYPKKTKSNLAIVSPPYPTSSLRMGIPAPTAAPAVAVTGSATNPSDPGEDVTFEMTYVSTWGEEGPPSPASTVVTWRAGQTLALTSLPGNPAGAYDITGKRLYRSATGSASTKFQLTTVTGDIPIATTTYNDTRLTANLGAVLATAGWLPPPDNMIGLTVMAGGVLAGFFDQTICLCEPGAPYAWPTRYQRSVDAPIVGMAAFDQSLVVLTNKGVYVLTGTDPGNMVLEKLAVKQSCIAKRSIVAMMGGVLWASPDGLCFMGPGGFKMISEGLFTRPEWQLYTPSSIYAYETDNRYLAFFNTGARAAGMVFTFGDTPTFCETDVYLPVGYRDSAKDSLFLVNGSNVHKWDSVSGTPLSYDWTSGVFHLPNDVNMACARVDASAYPVTFKLYADGALKHTQTVGNSYAFRLPAGYRSMRYHFNLTGTPTVRSVEVASSMQELHSE